MDTLLTLEELLNFDNNHYFGEVWFVTINNKPYSFIKGYIFNLPNKFEHKLYNVKNNQCATYVIRDLNTGKVYIGSTSEIYKRVAKHKWAIERKRHSNAKLEELLKVSSMKDFELIIIFTEDRNEAYDVEQFLVDHYGNNELLLNIQKDVKTFVINKFTMLGRKATTQHKLKMREAMLGKTHTEEAKQRMSDFRKNNDEAITQFKSVLDAKKRRISVYGVEYDSLTQAGIQSKYSESFLRRSLTSNRDPNIFYTSDNESPLKGRAISDEQKQKLSEFRKTDPKSITQLESIRELQRKKIIVNGTLYESVREAIKVTGIPESTIHKCIKRNNKKMIDGIYVISYQKKLPRKVLVNGLVYDSLSIAARMLSLNKHTLKTHARAGKIKYV